MRWVQLQQAANKGGGVPRDCGTASVCTDPATDLCALVGPVAAQARAAAAARRSGIVRLHQPPCPAPECSGLLQHPSQRYRLCTVCVTSFCADCMATQAAHGAGGPASCAALRAAAEQAQRDAAFEAAVPGAGVKPCPCCLVQTDKTDGCNTIWCDQCLTWWCYLCGEVLVSAHAYPAPADAADTPEARATEANSLAHEPKVRATTPRARDTPTRPSSWSCSHSSRQLCSAPSTQEGGYADGLGRCGAAGRVRALAL